jgi:hypothetical protein
MAQLPSEKFLVQQVGGNVLVFEKGTEREVVRFPVQDRDAVTVAQWIIHDYPEMSAEDKMFAHFWCGYFWAHAPGAAL